MYFLLLSNYKQRVYTLGTLTARYIYRFFVTCQNLTQRLFEHALLFSWFISKLTCRKCSRKPSGALTIIMFDLVFEPAHLYRFQVVTASFKQSGFILCLVLLSLSLFLCKHYNPKEEPSKLLISALFSDILKVSNDLRNYINKYICDKKKRLIVDMGPLRQSTPFLKDTQQGNRCFSKIFGIYRHILRANQK